MKPQNWFKQCKIELVDTEEKLRALALEVEKCTHYAMDLETSGLDWLSHEIAGIGISPALDHGYYIPINHKDSINLTLDQVREILYPAMKERTAIYWNATFDKSFLKKVDLDTPKYEDAMILFYHFDTEKYARYGLKAASKDFLNREMIEFLDLFTDDEKFEKLKKGGYGKSAKKDLKINSKTAEHVYKYGASDVINTFRLYVENRHKLPKSLEAVYMLDNQYLEYIIDMQNAGFHTDKKYLINLKTLIESHINNISEKMEALAGMAINPRSSRNVWEALAKFNVFPTEKTDKGNYKFDEKTLTKIDHPLIKMMLQQKRLKNVVNTFVEPLIEGSHPKTGKCHSMYNSTFVVTGRLSSNGHPTAGGVNSQQIAKEIMDDKKDSLYETFKNDSVRKAIIPPPGYFLNSDDLSAAELRIAAHMSGEPIWIEGFRNNEDLHQKLADNINARIPGLDISRAKAKNAQFNLLYAFYWGIFASNQGITMDEAGAIYQAFFSTVKVYAKWREAYKAQMRETGCATTLFGRRRILGSYAKAQLLQRLHVNKIIKKPREMWSQEERDLVRKCNSYFAQGDREGINHRIQGTCLDLIKIACLRIRKAMIARGVWMTDVIPYMCVHDEVNFAIKGDPKDPRNIEIMAEINSIMEIAPDKFKVPLVSEAEIGNNWKELNKIDLKEHKQLKEKIPNVG